MRSRSSEPSSPERAWVYALKLLSARDYTVAKLREKLKAREFAEGDVNAALRRLEAERYIDDRRFAERFAEAALSSGRFVGPRLRLEMRRRGVPAETITTVLAEQAAEQDENENLRMLLDRRFPGFSFATATDREKRRLVGFLQRRGFTIATIMRVLKAERMCGYDD